jgi:hypothetical protein
MIGSLTKTGWQYFQADHVKACPVLVGGVQSDLQARDNKESAKDFGHKHGMNQRIRW